MLVGLEPDGDSVVHPRDVILEGFDDVPDLGRRC
jgi:hypothetical protein